MLKEWKIVSVLLLSAKCRHCVIPHYSGFVSRESSSTGMIAFLEAGIPSYFPLSESVSSQVKVTGICRLSMRKLLVASRAAPNVRLCGIQFDEISNVVTLTGSRTTLLLIPLIPRAPATSTYEVL
ncbi:hypothetical protein BDN72DRAFT_846772 [Pluteus cervinus]|uniref:Uncharacterized protein n=1 Tax=Pluteus cervinus TaxID=181527 RepID=A0ACD3AF07_9AGAR|nr:hypothetical protein BDN72DRAFT_846772 [Pluteus cervinus]